MFSKDKGKQRLPRNPKKGFIMSLMTKHDINQRFLCGTLICFCTYTYELKCLRNDETDRILFHIDTKYEDLLTFYLRTLLTENPLVKTRLSGNDNQNKTKNNVQRWITLIYKWLFVHESVFISILF